MLPKLNVGVAELMSEGCNRMGRIEVVEVEVGRDEEENESRVGWTLTYRRLMLTAWHLSIMSINPTLVTRIHILSLALCELTTLSIIYLILSSHLISI